MRFAIGALAQLMAVVLLTDALRRVGLSFADCVDLILVPLILANAAGALLWAWSAPTVRRRA